MSAKVKDWNLDDLGGGIDLRDGDFSKEQNRFRACDNVHTTNARKSRRRPPAIKVSGTFGATSYGLVQRDGALYAFVPRGAVSPTFPAGVTILTFDLPFAATSYQVKEVNPQGDTITAVIKHQTAAFAQNFLHVWDSAPDLPTYTLDPEFPWAHTVGLSPGFVIPRTVMAEAESKTFMSGPTGNTHYSGVARPRLWWSKTIDDLLNFGYEFHFYAAATGVQAYTVPLKYEDLKNLTKYYAYVLEQYIGTNGNYQDNNNWGTVGNPGAAISEDAAAPAVDHWQLTSTPNTATVASYANWSKINVRPSVAGTWYRLRVLPPNVGAHPIPLYAVTGCIANYVVTEVYYGDGVKKNFDTTLPFSITAGAWDVAIAAVLKANPADYSVGAVYADARMARIIFTAAPADGQIITITRKPAAAPGLVVTAGTFMTPKGIKVWNGGEVPYVDPYSAWIAIDCNDNFDATGLKLIANIGGFTPSLSDCLGIDRAQNCILGHFYHNGGSGIAKLPAPDHLTSRTAIWDETAYQVATDLVGASVDSQDTGVLPTASHDTGGGLITAIGGIKNHLLVTYRGGSQLWEVHEDGRQDRRLDRSPIGTGDQPTPYPALFNSILMMPMANTFWGMGLGTDLSDAIRETRLGDRIERNGVPLMQASCYWPALGQYVAAYSIGGVFGFAVFDYSRENKIAAWANWTCAGISSVDYQSMIPIGDRLYFRSGSSLYYFDAGVYLSASPSFRDSNDPPGAGNAYRSRLRWHHNDFEKPNTRKRFLYADVVQAGTSTMSFEVNAADGNQVLDGPTISGTTYGSQRVGLSMIADTLAPILESTDETGWELQRVALGFTYGRR